MEAALNTAGGVRIRGRRHGVQPTQEIEMGGLSIWHWLIVLVIVLLIFGTKKLRNIGEDLGGAVKGFKEGIKDGAKSEPASGAPPVADKTVIDIEAREKSRF